MPLPDAAGPDEDEGDQQEPGPGRARLAPGLLGFIDAKFLEIAVHCRVWRASIRVYKSFLRLRKTHGASSAGVHCIEVRYRSRMVATMPRLEADQAGKKPPSAPINAAKANPQKMALGPMRNLKVVSLKVVKLPTP